jgi:hypothetical protein
MRTVLCQGSTLKSTTSALFFSFPPNLQNISIRTPVEKIREALSQAIILYNSGEWKPVGSFGLETVIEGSDSEEEFNLEAEESEWENVSE